MMDIKLPLLTDYKELAGYKARFNDAVKWLSNTKREQLPPAELRAAEVATALDEYVATTGKTPDKDALHLLANYLLADILKDPSSNKTSVTEYPIRSQYSHYVTPFREVSHDTGLIDYLHSKYVLEMDNLFKVSTINSPHSEMGAD